MVDFFQHVFQTISVLLGLSGNAECHLGLVAQDRQRGAQLVGGVGGEPPDFLERSFKPRDHSIERACQTPQLVIGVGLVQAPVKLGRRDLVGRRGHALDRGQCLAGQQVSSSEGATHREGPEQKQDGHQLAELFVILFQRRGNLNDQRNAVAVGEPADHPEPTQAHDGEVVEDVTTCTGRLRWRRQPAVADPIPDPDRPIDIGNLNIKSRMPRVLSLEPILKHPASLRVGELVLDHGHLDQQTLAGTDLQPSLHEQINADAKSGEGSSQHGAVPESQPPADAQPPHAPSLRA